MIQSNQKQSLLVPYELPKFISEDPQYANFTLFLKAYYEWMEQTTFTVEAGSGAFTQGENVTQGDITATVKGFDTTNNLLYLSGLSGTPIVGVPFVGSTSGTSRILLNSGQANTLNFSKSLLSYIDGLLATVRNQVLNRLINTT